MHRSNLRLVIPCLLALSCASVCTFDTCQAESPSRQSDIGIQRSFTRFKEDLLEAVKRRDRDFVEQIIAPNIETGFGAAAGKEALNEKWQNLSPQSHFWPRLQRILEHGHEWNKETGEMSVPGFDLSDESGDAPQALVWNNNVPLLPVQESLRQSQSACEILPLKARVAILEPKELSPVETGWAIVRTKNGNIGKVKSSDIYSQYDEFALFKNLGGKWKMTWFGWGGT